MIETEPTPEQARLADGTWVSPQDAFTTMVSIYRALSSNALPNRIDTVVQIRSRIDDLESLIKDTTSPHDPDGDYARRKINETLTSPIFDIEGADTNWTVPPKTALAVLRSMVVVEVSPDTCELHVQEPFSDRELLAAAWEAHRQR